MSDVKYSFQSCGRRYLVNWYALYPLMSEAHIKKKKNLSQITQILSHCLEFHVIALPIRFQHQKTAVHLNNNPICGFAHSPTTVRQVRKCRLLRRLNWIKAHLGQISPSDCADPGLPSVCGTAPDPAGTRDTSARPSVGIVAVLCRRGHDLQTAFQRLCTQSSRVMPLMRSAAVPSSCGSQFQTSHCT